MTIFLMVCLSFSGRFSTFSQFRITLYHQFAAGGLFYRKRVRLACCLRRARFFNSGFRLYINIDGVNKRLTSKTFYEDSTRKVRTESDLYNEGDAIIKGRTTADQLGRPILAEKNENGANNYTISSQTVYKPTERVVMSSNPTKNIGELTDGWTRVTSDILGRPIETATFSGSIQPPISGGITSSNFTGRVLTDYSANTTTVTDQAGKQRRSIVNAIGQLTRIDEPNNNGNLGTIASPNQPTNYAYDILGNLITVNQSVQTRSFEYDSLSRLRFANKPTMKF